MDFLTCCQLAGEGVDVQEASVAEKEIVSSDLAQIAVKSNPPSAVTDTPPAATVEVEVDTAEPIQVKPTLSLPKAGTPQQPQRDHLALAKEGSASLDEQVRFVIVGALLEPIFLNGRPLSVLVGDNQKLIKLALTQIDDANSKVLLKTLFENPDAGHTHRDFSIQISNGQFKVERESVTPSASYLEDTPTRCKSSARQEAEQAGISLQPGTVLCRGLLGPDVSSDLTSKAGIRVVHLHLLVLGNLKQPQAQLDLVQCLLKLSHFWFAGAIGARADNALRDSIGKVMPQTGDLFQVFFDADRTENKVEMVESAPGVLRHTCSTYWNWPAIEKRFGKRARLDIQKQRPAHAVISIEGGPEDDPYYLAKWTEDHGLIEISFLTVSSGRLGCYDKHNVPLLTGGDAQAAPALLSGEIFRCLCTEVKFALAGCGCWISEIDGPNMTFAMQGADSPHPSLKLWCIEVGAFPMEWFYRPLINATHLRLLLSKQFQLQINFEGEEVHMNVTFQIPTPNAILRKFGRLLCGMIITNIKAPVEEDPLASLQEAFASDCLSLERCIEDAKAIEDGQDPSGLVQQISSGSLSPESLRRISSSSFPESVKSNSAARLDAVCEVADLERGSAGRSPQSSKREVRRSRLCLCRCRARKA